MWLLCKITNRRFIDSASEIYAIQPVPKLERLTNKNISTSSDYSNNSAFPQKAENPESMFLTIKLLLLDYIWVYVSVIILLKIIPNVFSSSH